MGLIHQMRNGEPLSGEDAKLMAEEVDRLNSLVPILSDKIDGLEADLASAVEVAWKRGAHEWVRLNYPSFAEKMEAKKAEAPGS